jgi:hypothetical protein
MSNFIPLEESSIQLLGNHSVPLDDNQIMMPRTKFIHNDNWIPVTTINLDWFETADEYVEFFSSTLNRWSMPTEVLKARDENIVACADEGFTIKVAESSIQGNKPIHEVTMHSNGKHINSLLLEIIECLRVQQNTANELTEDEAFALIDVELKDMNEYQVQLYSYNMGQDSREEIAEWAQEHSGFCDNVKRVSYGKFRDAVIAVSLKNLNNVCGATFTNCRFTCTSTLENITFIQCIFDNVEFDCKLNKVTFDDCIMKTISWPNKGCNVQIYNHEDDDEHEDLEYDDA